MVVVIKGKNINRKLSPLVGEGGGEAVERGKYEQKGKNSFCKTVLNTCPSFSNEVKNPSRESGN